MKNLGERLGEANQELQKNVDRSEHQILGSYGLVGSILVLGTVGYLTDRWAGTKPLFVIMGLIVGVLFGFYSVVSAVRSGK
jgi:F0F1-type ATP synthase assembly protein I